MGRKDRSFSGSSAQGAAQPAKRLYANSLKYALCFLLGVAAAGGTAFILYQNTSSPSAGQTTSATPQKVRSLGELLAMTLDELAKVDIAEMNLVCATGLPGAEEVDIGRSLATLDRWAERVKAETERHLYRLTDPRYKDHAEHYRNSEARFRAEWLVSILQQDIGLHYHPGFVAADKPVQPPKTSKECFLHGLMDNDDPRKAFGGNCLSLPVAYAAVGRRLGYPIKMVCAKEHAFCRWEGADHPNPAWRDRFNFDGAGNGFSIDPDEFYVSWPRKSTPDQVELCDWLKSLTPQQDLAVFMAHRGHVLADVSKDYTGALVAYSQCALLWPTSRSPLQELQMTIDRLWTLEIAAHPKTYRRVYGVEVVDGRVVSCEQPTLGRPVRDPLADIEMINEINRRNMQRMMQPPVPPMASPYGPRPGVPQPYGLPMPGQPPR
ncbi:MAG: hypothetical protein NTY65_16205 [Planctomycetota bacterium]|nr:hypothetical protein [Planctomycetota bacterium]